jgi:hypothetical protein
MSTYRAKTAHDVALGSLTVLDPQPRSEGVKATRRSYAANGAVYDEGLYVELVWDYLADATAYQTLLAVFGLSASVAYADVTVYVRNQVYAFTRYNGIAVRPELGVDGAWSSYFPRNLTILIKHLEALA